MGCCIIGVCCPPGSPKQVQELAAWLAEHEPASTSPVEAPPPASYEDIATRLLDTYRLVPRTIEAGRLGATEEELALATRELDEINENLNAELHHILELAGHPTEKES